MKKQCAWARGIVSRVIRDEDDEVAHRMVGAAMRVCGSCNCGKCAPLMMELDRKSDPEPAKRRRTARA